MLRPSNNFIEHITAYGVRSMIREPWVLSMCSGPQPADNEQLTGTLLCQSAPFALLLTDDLGSLTIEQPLHMEVIRSGVLGYFEIHNTAHSSWNFTGTIGTSGTDICMSSTVLAEGMVQVLTSLNINLNINLGVFRDPLCSSYTRTLPSFNESTWSGPTPEPNTIINLFTGGIPAIGEQPLSDEWDALYNNILTAKNKQVGNKTPAPRPYNKKSIIIETK